MVEPTVTQNNALYFAQHKNSKERATLFRRFKFGASKKRVPSESANARGSICLVALSRREPTA